jgi:hypothetical protein
LCISKPCRAPGGRLAATAAIDLTLVERLAATAAIDFTLVERLAATADIALKNTCLQEFFGKRVIHPYIIFVYGGAEKKVCCYNSFSTNYNSILFTTPPVFLCVSAPSRTNKTQKVSSNMDAAKQKLKRCSVT